jgi:hypothetical protein
MGSRVVPVPLERPSLGYFTPRVFKFFNIDLGFVQGHQSSKALKTQIYLNTISYGSQQVGNHFYYFLT